jgi:hypothetical protein
MGAHSGVVPEKFGFFLIIMVSTPGKYWCFFFVKGAPQPSSLLCKPVMKMISFLVFPCNGAPVE